MSRLLAPLLVLAASMSLLGNARAESPTSPGTSTYLVSFVEPPLAAFHGFEPSGDAVRSQLKATSPEATGAERLDVASPDSRAYREWLGERRAKHLSDISAVLGRPIKAGVALDVVNNLVSLELTATEAAAVARLASVAMVEEEFFLRPQTDAGPAWIGASRVWQGVDGLASRGEGVVVGVIDSGINRTHPSFSAFGLVDGYIHSNPRGRFYGLCESNAALCNSKLIGIYDFSVCTGVHASSSCDDREANDGLDGSGHGSHVASTAVGNVLRVTLGVGTGSEVRTLSGVAPHANVIAYKACEGEEICRATWLLAAINQAVADGVAVINASFNGECCSNPWLNSGAIAMLNAREAGVVVVAAVGKGGLVYSPASAPWVLSVGESTHDRVIASRLVDLTGGATAPPSDGVLMGAGASAGFGPASIVIPLDFPGCSTGDDPDSPPTGVSNPWSEGRFNGEIVVCERGTQARVAKSNNVRLAGGGGMVLANRASDRESIFADEHSIPTTHLGWTAASPLRTWLSSGSGHRGRIEGERAIYDPSFADLHSSTSPGGSGFGGGSLNPSISAPGTSIVAAAGTGSGFAFLSGTSMATAHISGAAALLRALRPDWTVSDIESALMTSAKPVVRFAGRPASPFNQGSGRAAVDDALRAGLSFRVSTQQFRDAQPSLGGDPRTLNQPAIIDANCEAGCRFSRTVTDLVGGGGWRAVVTFSDRDEGARAVVSPAEFDLAPGGSQLIVIEVYFEGSFEPQIAGFVEGQIEFQRTSGPAAGNARVPIDVYFDSSRPPDLFQLNLDDDRGAADFSLADLRRISDLTPVVTSEQRPSLSVSTLAQDPTGDPYDSIATGKAVSLITLPGSPDPVTYRIRVGVSSTTSPAARLYVGKDLDGDGLPSSSEQIYPPRLQIPPEFSTLDVTSQVNDSQVWVVVQNFRAGASGEDELLLEQSVIALVSDPSSNLTATAASRMSTDVFSVEPKIRLEADLPESAPGDRYIAYVGLAEDATTAPFAWVPAFIERSLADERSERLLLPDRPITMRLSAGAAHDRLFVDVPPNAGSMRVVTQGSGEVDLFFSRIATPSTPTIDPAPPRDQAEVAVVAPGADNDVLIESPTLGPGRWYVTPVNVGSETDAIFSIDLSMTFNTPRPQPRFGAYFDPGRSGSGLFLFGAGESWGLAWYTYLEDGTPTWYLGVAPRPGSSEGLWAVDLLRYRWNGVEALGTPVGEASLSLVDREQFEFNFNLDEYSGSQTMRWIGDTRCPSAGGSQLDVSGLWFTPSRPGFGYSVIASPDFESIGAYFYDGNGIARWALGSNEQFGATSFNLQERLGPCPLCSYFEPTISSLQGPLTRTFENATTGEFSTLFPEIDSPTFRLGQWWVEPLPASKLSDPVGCD